MTDLAAAAVRAVEHLSVNDDPAADARSERYEQRAAAADPAAVPKFAERGAVCVVACLNAQAAQRAECFVQIKHAPVEVDAAIDQSVVVYRPRDADADAEQRLLLDARAHGLNGRRDVRKDGLASLFRPRRDLPLFQ